VDIGNDKAVCEIISRLGGAGSGNGPVKVCGTWGSFAPLLAAHISQTLKRPILYVSPHIDDADDVSGDIQVFAGRAIEMFAVREDQDYISEATDEIWAQRLRVAMGLWQAKENGADLSELIISTPVQALNQPIARPELLAGGGLKLRVNETMEPELVVSWLIDNGFERVDSVDIAGQFAVRGGIIDIFAPVTVDSAGSFDKAGGGEPEPVRVEFFGDRIESIRVIDLDSQRSSCGIESICIVGDTGDDDEGGSGELFVNLLPENTIIIVDEPLEAEDVSGVFLSRVDDPSRLYDWQAIYKAMGRFTMLEISRFGGGEDYLHLDVSSAQEFEHKSGSVWKGQGKGLEPLLAVAQGRKVLLYCENSAEVDRVSEIIADSGKKAGGNLKLLVGFIRQGFIFNSLDTIVVSHHEIFGQFALRRRIRKIRSASPVESLLDLQKGDYVVHVSYGIGKFLGIKTMDKRGSSGEYLTIEYAGKSLIHVPVRNINLIGKYIGSLPKRPPLSKIGSKKWENQKARVAKGIEELASELLDVQARRRQLGGFAFDKDSVWQKEFEQSFVYQETPDQLTAAGQINDDMTEAVAMDRLLCGDVGYGKTELAMRAAFKAVQSGKQVAVLVPTTVLCIQHGRTFSERFADFPVTIETLNRFVSVKGSKDIVRRAKQGKVDVVIGTHRLLSDDVGFKDLGLLIIDEEQRFGVEHKERLKRFRINVDILTLTATPIPRTLHMSLLGLRDISSLGTPPLDRRSIVTKVCRYDRPMIRKVIMNELNRQGQIFFVHNRVQSIVKVADEVRKIINDDKVSIDIGHGQMAKHELEKAMLKFVGGQTDILVCSTIIESGLDIPNANTMIINDADRFGLAQLHQLRGRVGRYNRRAYAYMLLPFSRPITPTAAKRLKAIEEYSQLGAGFRIALRDLEIRGAGNILGSQQSGHINTIGYDLYCKLLGETVKRLKNEPIEKPASALIDLGFSSYIPKSYIPSDRQRMDIYRRIGIAQGHRDLKRLKDELCDLFGPVPKQVDELLDLTDLRIKASKWEIKSIIASSPDLIFTFESDKGASELFARAPGIVRIPDARTVHLRLEKNYFEPMTLMSILRKMFRMTG